MLTIRFSAIALSAITVVACTIIPLPPRQGQDAETGVDGAGGSSVGANRDAASTDTTSEASKGTGGVGAAGGGGGSAVGGATGSGSGAGTGGATTLSCIVSGAYAGYCSKAANCMTCNQAVQTGLNGVTGICCASLGLLTTLSTCASTVCNAVCTGSGAPGQACLACRKRNGFTGCANQFACCTADSLGSSKRWQRRLNEHWRYFRQRPGAPAQAVPVLAKTPALVALP